MKTITTIISLSTILSCLTLSAQETPRPACAMSIRSRRLRGPGSSWGGGFRRTARWFARWCRHHLVREP